MPTIDRTIGAFHDSSTSRIRKIGKYTGPVSYATGGDSFAASDIGMGRIEHLVLGIAINAALSVVRLLIWDPGTQKILWYVPNTGAEVAAATDVSGFVARFEAIGQ